MAPISKTKPAEIVIGILAHTVFSVGSLLWNCHLVPLHRAALGSNEGLSGKALQSVEGEGVSICKTLLEILFIELMCQDVIYIFFFFAELGSLLRSADLTDSTMLVEASIAVGPESGLERSTRGVLIHLGCLPEVPQV